MDVEMIDGKRYLRMLSQSKPFSQRCPHCGSTTLSVSGKAAFCNFCEQHVDILSSGALEATSAEIPFASVLNAVKAGNWEEAGKGADLLMKGNKYPGQLYLLGVFYRRFSTLKFQSKDYNQMGFMLPNARNIRDSLDLTTRWKECFFKTIKMVGDELKANIQIEPELVFIKFMSEIRVGKLVDASSTLQTLQSLDKRGTLSEYALLVFSVEKDTKQAEASLIKALEQGETNAYYYLSKYLAKHNKLAEAEVLLQKLGETTEVSMAAELMHRIKLTEEASRM